jgi:hypothetical protein
MRPPEDAPPPWRCDATLVEDRVGNTVAIFAEAAHAAYAVAAANALPGLVEALGKARAHAQSYAACCREYDWLSTAEEFSRLEQEISAALAALPEGMRTP